MREVKKIKKILDIVKLVCSNTLTGSITMDEDSIFVEFIICDFNPNKNGIQINRESIENWIQTLCNKPVVGKVEENTYGVDDFTSHNIIYVKKVDEDGNEYTGIKFDTLAFGSFISVEIQEIDGQEYIVATAELWRRFENACNVVLNRIETGVLYTSWEIGVKESHYSIVNGKKIKIIDDGKFLAHCCLAANVEPAYDSSRLVAEVKSDFDSELTEALSKDIEILISVESEEKELKNLKNKSTEDVVVENTVLNSTVKDGVATNNTAVKAIEEDLKTAALTDWDIRHQLNEACREKVSYWCWVSYVFSLEKYCLCEYEGGSELDYKRFDFEIVDDKIVVSDPIDVKLVVSISEVNSTVAALKEKNETLSNSLADANSTIQDLNGVVAELNSYKDKFNKIEQTRIANELKEKQDELKEYAAKSNFITKEELETSDEIINYINDLNETGIKAIIAERYMQSLANQKEMSSVPNKSNITISNTGILEDETSVLNDKNYKLIMSAYLD